jgi:DNA-directed RNA polymerase specialized sigma24 family protein
MTLADGLEPTEIARTLGLSPEAVRQRKSRALKRLLARLNSLSRRGEESPL